MEQVQTFLEMGGYGFFVWPAFALTAVVLIGMLVTTLRRLRAVQGDLDRLQAPEPSTAGTRMREAR